MMPVQIKEVTRRRELREFIYLPAKIHRNHQKWAPPIYADEWRYLNPEKNIAFSYCDTVLGLAHRNNAFLGRIMGIINRRHNELRDEKTARFAYLECFEDKEVAHALLDFVEQWAQRNGMRRIVGPMGFTDQDPEGFLVEGFEHEPTIATYYNFEYIPSFLEAEGYRKEVDYVVYKVKVPAEIPEVYKRICKRLLVQTEYRLVEFTKRKELKPYIRPTLNLMNETFANLYGYVPLDEKELDHLAKRYLPVVDPRFAKVVTKDGQVIAFILGVPNMDEGFRQAKGHLFPLGIFKIFRAAKKSKQLDLLLGGIKEEYRGRGLDVLMGQAMMRSARNAGFEYMDSHHELETNLLVRAEMERGGGEIYKRYRIFQKHL